MASSNFTVSAVDFSDVQYKFDSSTLLVVDEDSKQKNGCKWGDGEGELRIEEEKMCSPVPKERIFKLANQQLIFKQEIKTWSAENVFGR